MVILRTQVCKQVTWLVKVVLLRKSREWTAEDVRLQAATGNWQRWCGHEMARQGSGDWKSSISDCWQPCTTDSQWWRRRWSNRQVRRLEEFVDQVRWEPIGKCLRRVDCWCHRWRHATLWRHARDVTIFKVVAFGNYDPGHLSVKTTKRAWKKNIERIRITTVGGEAFHVTALWLKFNTFSWRKINAIRVVPSSIHYLEHCV